MHEAGRGVLLSLADFGLTGSVEYGFKYRMKIKNKFEKPYMLLLDYDDVILHIFYAPVRRLYDIERLWDDVPRVEIEIPAELRGNDGIYQGYVVE